MIKTAFAAAAAAVAFAAPGAALAGPYVNVEANSGWTGSNYTGTNTDRTLDMKVHWVKRLLTMFKRVLPSFLLTAALLTLFLLVRQVWALP